MGYKKHTMRVWLPQAGEQVLLVPLVTWVAPANRGDALFLHPSIHYCDKHLDWLPEMVVGDRPTLTCLGKSKFVSAGM